MTENNTQLALIEAIKELTAPFKMAAEDSEFRANLLRQIGWDLEDLPASLSTELNSSLSSISTLVDSVILLIDSPPETLIEFVDALSTIEQLLSAAKELGDVVDLSSLSGLEAGLKTEFKKVGKDLFDFLFGVYLQSNHPQFFYSLCVLGIIDPHEISNATEGGSTVSDAWRRGEYSKPNFQFGNIASLFTDPLQYLKGQYFPASQVLDTEAEAKEFSDKLFPKIVTLLASFGVDAWYGLSSDLSSDFSADNYAVISRTLTIELVSGTGTKITLSLLYSPTATGGYGLVIVPKGDLSLAINRNKWNIEASLSAAIDGFSINDTGVQFPTSFTDGSLKMELLVSRLFENGITNNQIGSTTGSRLEIGRTSFRVFGDFSSSSENYGITMDLHQVKLTVGSEGDGFIRKILPNGAEAKFNVGIGWSKQSGIAFSGSGTLNLYIPTNFSIGPVDFKGVKLGVEFDNSDINLGLGATLAAQLGPVELLVEDIGIDAELSFPSSGGNLGAANIDVGFRSPKGLGLKIETDAVTGAGYLSFNKAEEKYAGAAELTIKDKISLKAFGMLTTRVPGDEDGYSLLLLITATGFTPIQLGFGFTLSGIGGLLALHRTMNLQVLRDGVKNNSLDNILFPDDPVGDIQEIMTDLDSAFPIQQNRFVFGIMGIINWGTPALISMEVGLMLEVPAPVRFAILGVIKSILPTEEKSLLKLQVNFLGTIDFEAKYITFDASLFDSRLITFTLSGDMAFRLKWGNNANFLLSVGGFHPSYTPPPLNLPSMQRMTINLLGGNNPRLTVWTYFAITSNTIQFGAGVDFYFKVTGKIKVVGEFGLDVLIQYSPFYLRADIYARLAVMRKSKSLLSLSVRCSLEGPSPWHVKGKASFKVLGMKLKMNFDKTFGRPETNRLDNENVLTKLEAEAAKPENWKGELPSRSNLLVRINEEAAPPQGDVLTHPFGSMQFLQKLVPLDMTIEKFSKGIPVPYNRFSVDMIDSAGTKYSEIPLTEQFAPNEFLNLSKSQKFSMNSFENYPAGIRVTGTEAYDAGFYRSMDVSYEVKTFDVDNLAPSSVSIAAETIEEFEYALANNAMANSNLGRKNAQLSVANPTKVVLDQEAFAISNRSDLSVFSDQGNDLFFDSEAAAYQALKTLCSNNPALEEEVGVVSTYEMSLEL